MALMTSRLRPDKRRAILDAARASFGRQGYVRAATEAIARDAGVSTRTLYNHFPSKQELLRTVLVDGAAEVAEAFQTRAARLDTNARADDVLLALGHALAAHRLDFPEHFAVAQHVAVERGHFPDGLVEAWRRAGPEAVESRVADVLARLARAGALRDDDHRHAAEQLILLTAGAIAFAAPPGTSLDRAAAGAIIARGVRTFLHGHARRS